MVAASALCPRYRRHVLASFTLHSRRPRGKAADFCARQTDTNSPKAEVRGSNPLGCASFQRSSAVSADRQSPSVSPLATIVIGCLPILAHESTRYPTCAPPLPSAALIAHLVPSGPRHKDRPLASVSRP